jgi:hypothetical protein
MQSSGALRRENADVCLSVVIARPASAEAIQTSLFGLDRFAIADGDGCLNA